MPDAMAKFVEAMNKTSNYWTKTVEVTVQAGEITVVRYDGFTWKTDGQAREEGVK
jgi:hypothetical protein